MTCRVCGKEYEPCRTAIRAPGVFHWQEVACSPECGEVYLRRIMESRRSAHAPGESGRGEEERQIEDAADIPSPADAGAAGEWPVFDGTQEVD